MPELPEIETVTRGLQKSILGCKFKDIKLSEYKLRISFPDNLKNLLVGSKVIAIARRAKYVVIELDNGLLLIIHLGMSGKIFITDHTQTAFPKHTHFIGTMDQNTIFYLVDARRFGLVTTVAKESLNTHHLFSNLGPEPLTHEFNTAYLLDSLKSKSIPIKVALMDNKIVVGVGNIYASESLFLAGISPLRPASTLTAIEGQKLVNAIRVTLNKAIDLGGSTLKDYQQVNGEKGYFQSEFNVYGRNKLACYSCSTEIIKIVQSQRATFYCAICQK
ncbi:bifunctional DNA-formamidopyrimidine glycosylase/DNA-(apurinic or apyrimidinic site) lyase [Rickettsiales endosymbiont of Stachyamoeba lipophora]|uniref:bifunctional DNA-formamidopyrimidine glycosylase/DNA-(apurinic or apyrimidinic site) lyase n=1 Tax=Rickettsiales endosymbiont of Stachyamoeba lipophora TaxID=2486578 RepID=UPI000F645D3C|nr:bifunctional DNA-formamidopyrimidine glycosylase/DNA-(apurinic or apyrimidinic site) lyase [Rickettsiales endosymbiont of Stachyamoeba lipophora]AZL15754.1 bifunctional DNA-formamidopyrimidine glycosylase/DNA-(apurinic or apyrimidinic site) lyase [Rickettsiales endosymbiont of Stachyamoeba lipophora]